MFVVTACFLSEWISTLAARGSEVERVGCLAGGDSLFTLLLQAEWRGVSEQDTLTAPDELDVALRGWHHHRCVNVCMNGWKLGNIIVNIKAILYDVRELAWFEISFSSEFRLTPPPPFRTPCPNPSTQSRARALMLLTAYFNGNHCVTFQAIQLPQLSPSLKS